MATVFASGMLTEYPDPSPAASPSMSAPFWIWAFVVRNVRSKQIPRSRVLKFRVVIFFIAILFGIIIISTE